MKAIQNYFGDSLRFAFRNFPLTQIHPHAQQAAEAAETAGAQGKFWEMHDILYENQEALDYPSLREYAQNLELDMERFDDELINHVYGERVRDDFLSGVMSGVNGTPTFYLNGHRFDGSWNGDELVKAIEESIKLNRKNKTSRRM
jgi:protein-disulfide isomerase